jgi:pimeloyl-ACP methyl ester carboxylesterase
MMTQQKYRCLLLALTLFPLVGCSLLEIKEQAEIADNLASIHGRIDLQTTQSGAVYVRLFQRTINGAEVVRESVLAGSREYVLPAIPGSYLLGAFVDVNNDKEYQRDEPATYWGMQNEKPTPIEAVAKANLAIDTLVIKGPVPVSATANIDIRSAIAKPYLNIGKIISLDDPMFSRESAEMGLWRPVDFVTQYGGGLMLLQAYDPKKIPVVFVHGISGSARSFDKVIESLDTKQFQPWVLQYPSGMRLDDVSDYLQRALNDLHARYKFPRIAIVAHSMGGLMTRSFVMKHEQSQSLYQIAFGITINSPLQGMDSAASGVKTSPIVVPAWRDLASNSEYVQRVTAWQWPKAIPYHLVFSYLPGEESDGVIPLKSQLSLSLQDQAVRIYGFQNEHTKVLVDPEFVKRLMAIMSSYKTP